MSNHRLSRGQFLRSVQSSGKIVKSRRKQLRLFALNLEYFGIGKKLIFQCKISNIQLFACLYSLLLQETCLRSLRLICKNHFDLKQARLEVVSVPLCIVLNKLNWNFPEPVQPNEISAYLINVCSAIYCSDVF